MDSARLIDLTPSAAANGLLDRAPATIDHALIRSRIQGKVVMVTGAAGSIGSELCRQIGEFEPLALVAFDQAETPLFHLERELSARFPGTDFECEIGSTARFEDVSRAMRSHRPSIVFHAAAYKHVSMLERHPFAAVENNVFGTWQSARAAAMHGVESFVQVSTDKAVRPTSVMGATKRAAELAVRALQAGCATKFVTARLGNVLGSSGSVLPIFVDQIARGGPVTVTHPEMRRYFMTATEAGALLLQAFALGIGGEIFVLDMGGAVRIVDLAKKLIRLSGLHAEHDIEIQFTGIRPGEKLIEELHLEEERMVPTAHSNIRILDSPATADLGQITAALSELRNAMSARNQIHLIHLLKEMIPDYTPNAELLMDAMSNCNTPEVAVSGQNSSGNIAKSIVANHDEGSNEFAGRACLATV